MTLLLTARRAATTPFVAAGLLAMLLTGCDGAQQGGSVTDGRILVYSPSPGAKVDVGEALSVDVLAEHPTGIVRLELWVDGVKVDSAPAPAGEPTDRLQSSLFWTPNAPHSYALEVRAYDWQDQVLVSTSQVVNGVLHLEDAAALGPPGDRSDEDSGGSGTIRFFRASSEKAPPGELVTLEWSVSGAPAAQLQRLDEAGEPVQTVELAPSGRLDVTVEAAESGLNEYVLRVPQNEAEDLTASVTIVVQCTSEWFFPDAPEACASSEALVSAAVEQHFEGGTMLFVTAQNLVYVLLESGPNRTWKSYPNSFETGMPSVDAQLSPPQGYFQPEDELGLVWRSNPDVQSSLGWAIDPALPFGTKIQSTSRETDNLTFIRSVDGGLWRLEADGAGWSLRE